MTETPPQPSEGFIDDLLRLIESGDDDTARARIAGLHSAEIADLIEALPKEARERCWELVPVEMEADVLVYLHDEVRASIVELMDHRELIAAADAMDLEDLAEVVAELPEDLTEVVLNSLDNDRRQRLSATLAYPEGTAGRIMTRDVISVRSDVTLAVVLRYLRRFERLPDHTDALMVVDDAGAYQGKLPLSDLLTADPERRVAEFLAEGQEPIPTAMSESAVAALFDRRDLTSVAVVDDRRHLQGRITIDDVVDIIRMEADHEILKRAGLDEEEDLFAPVLASAKRRAVWLGVNLATVFLASWVIGHFERVLDQVVALAVLLPVVASMGGIAGSQALTLTIRGLATGQVGSGNVRWLARKEVAVGAINGAMWALVVAVVTALWFDSWAIGAIIAMAMVINLTIAAVSGVLIPFVLKRMGVDPALSGAVVLTTVTDVVGFLAFLGLGTVILL